MRRILNERRNRQGDAGVSFTELMVVMFLFTVIGIMVYDLLVGTAQTNLYLEANNDLSEYGQRLVNEIKTEVLQSKKLIGDGTQGQGYQAALDLSAAPTPLDTSSLATIDVNGSFSPSLVGDADHPFNPASVGNALLFAQAITPYLDESAGVRIDLYRLIYYYLTRSTAEEIESEGCILDLYRWESVVFADYNQLVRLNDYDDAGATLSAALGALATADPSTDRPAVTMAWNPDEDADSAFFSFASGSMATAPSTGYAVEMFDASPAISNMHEPRIGGKMVYSVAFNTSADFDLGDTVPAFGTADTNQDGFPHGFEVMMGGPTGGRKVLVRLVLAADSGNARLVSRENVVLINARDY